MEKALESEKPEIKNGQEKEIEEKNREPELFPCFLCGEYLEIKYSKRNKPYFICDPCGLQAFIRRDKGIHSLKKITGKNSKIPKKSEKTEKQVLRVINQLEKLRTKLKKVKIGD
jgi:hypothetical protein